MYLFPSLLLSVIIYLPICIGIAMLLTKTRNMSLGWATFFLFFGGLIIGLLIVSFAPQKNTSIKNDKMPLWRNVTGIICIAIFLLAWYLNHKLSSSVYDYPFAVWYICTMIFFGGSAIYSFTQHLIKPVENEGERNFENIVVEYVGNIIFACFVLCSLCLCYSIFQHH